VTLEMPVERLTFAIDPNPSGGGGVVGMAWEMTRVTVPFAAAH
jgi:hypothetical protein